MNLIEEIKSEFGLKKYRSMSLDFPVGDPIKNSRLIDQSDHLFQHQNFFQTAQILWHLSKHPEFFGYERAKEEKLFDLLGIENKELEGYIRSLEGNLIMDSNSLAKPGIFNDLVYSFRKKAKELPQVDKEYCRRNWPGEDVESIEEESKQNASRRDDKTVSLYRSSVYLPFIKDWQLGINVIWYAPSLCNTLKKMEKVYKRMIPSLKGDELMERIKRNITLMEELKIEPIDDLTNKALALVKEFASERYKRFHKSIIS